MASNLSALQQSIDSLEEVLDQIDPEWEGTPQTENLDGRDLLRNVETILGDLKRLLRGDHLKFYFSDNEVTQICQNIDQITAHIGNPQQIVSCLKPIRQHVRSYLIRGTAQDRAEKIAEVEDRIHELDDYLEERELLKRTNEELKAELEAAHESLETIETQVATLKGIQTTAEAHEEAAKESAAQASSSEGSAAASKIKMDDFIEKITTRETQLEDQTAKTVAFEKKLKELGEAYDADKETRDEQIQETEEQLHELIGQAREALELNTARGLSKEFGERAKSLRPGWGFECDWHFPFIHRTESGNKALWWMAFAGGFVFLAGAITLLLATNLLGSTPTNSSGGVDWYHLFSRLSAVGLFVTAAVFCANQYKRTLRLLEDYTYKKVVAASLPGFLSQFGEIGPDDTMGAMLLKKAVDEIHRHPLQAEEKGKVAKTERTSGKDSDTILELGDLKMIIKAIKSLDEAAT